MRYVLMMLVLAMMLLVYPAAPAAAQEVQVPFDAAGQVTTIDRRLAERTDLFVDEHPGFREARLFRVADDAFVLEITLNGSGSLTRERIALSAAQVTELRRMVAARIAERAPRAALNQEARYVLVGQSTVLGLGFYGWALPLLLDADETAGGLYLLTAGTSFFLPYLLTANAPVSDGMANLSRYGATRGAAHGLLLQLLLQGEEDRETVCSQFGCYEDDDDGYERRLIAGALFGSVAEGVGGYFWARRAQMSAGTASTIALGGDLGLLWGLGLAQIATPDDFDERTVGAIVLPLGLAGLAAGQHLAAARDYTWGDAEVMYTGSALGAFTAWMALVAGDVDNESAYSVAGIAGSAAGAYITDALVSGAEFSIGQSSLNRLGTVAGALAGGSIGALAENKTLGAMGAAVGALGGFAITYSTLSPDARGQSGEQSSAWKLHFSPGALLAGTAGSGGEDLAMPLFTVQHRFGGGR